MEENSLFWMISVGGRDEMELQAEDEEGEACFQNNNDDVDDSTIDPDVSLFYIDEKIQNVLGHCQKDFEGGFSAENLGAKFGEYGTFLPTYQRSPVWPHPNTRPKDLNCSAPISPNNAPIEGGNQNSVSVSNASQPIRNGPASFCARSGSAPRKSKSNNKLKQEVSTSCGNISESIGNFANHSDEKSLNVRIKVGSDNMLTKRNVEIYSGLGLDVSPSSSLEASPVNNDWFFHGPQDDPHESPTSILEMMTSFPVSGSVLLSPLPYDLLHLTEKKPDDNRCGRVHKGSQESIVTAVCGSDLVKVDQNVVGKKLMSTEKNSVSVESTNGVIDIPKKEMSVDNFAPGNKKTSSGGKGKAEGGLKNESFTSKTKKNDNGSKNRTEDFKKDGKVNETYKDFFGELDIEQEYNDEMAPEKRLGGVNKGTLENNSLLKQRLNGKKNQNLPASTMGNGQESDAAARTVVPVVNEDWVCCDICERWRLLPPGENPGRLPEKWICNMLDWLPGMNRCSISEEETTKTITSHDVIVEKVNLKQEENNKVCENFADEGDNIHHYKINNKCESAQDFPKNFKKEDSHIRKFDKRVVLKKRKKVKEFDGTGKYVKQTSETSHRKEKKSKVLKSFDEGISVNKIKNIEDMILIDSSRQSSVWAATSSSSKFSSSQKRNKKSQKQNGNQHLNVKNPTPEKHKEQRQDSTVVLVRELSNQATTNALREATNLKHMADRVKNNGSSLESRALYMEAALKFLHVASLFESCHSQTGRYGDMIQSVSIYNSTAKLCKYCAHEYERTKEMTTTSLAYKCMEVAYMKVVYSSIATACKDANELQTFLHIDPTGESPSSSASAFDLDNLNNPAAADKATLAKGVNAPQVAGNHVIAAINKPNFTRILNFTQNVNLAMEASMKSRIAFAASSSKEEAVVSAIKRALDFNFYDVEELLHRVRVAMELINR